MKLYFAIILTALSLYQRSAQRMVHGKVSELNQEKESVPLPFVNIHWSGTSQGTVTDENNISILISCLIQNLIPYLELQNLPPCQGNLKKSKSKLLPGVIGAKKG